MTKCAEDFSSYQVHPRYGNKPRVTGLNPSDEPRHGRVFIHWHSGSEARIPNTAVKADVQKQVPATVPVTHYFDSRRVCRDCGARFIFFAEEQKHWYETLRFPLEADMVSCFACRKAAHRLQEMRLAYEALFASPDRTPNNTLRLVDLGQTLVAEGVFSPKALPRLRGYLKNLGPGHEDEVEGLKFRMHELEKRGP